MTTKLEQLLGWMDSAEYAPTYGELHEKVKDLISEEQQVKNCFIADVVECAGNKRTPHEKRTEILSNPLWEYKAGLYKHFKWGWKTLDEAYQIVTS